MEENGLDESKIVLRYTNGMKKTTSSRFMLLPPAVIVAVVALLSGTVAAAQVSLPGSPLYGIKSATEDARLAAVFTNESKAKTHISIAKEKVRELELLSSIDAPVDVLEKTEAKFLDNHSRAEALVKDDTSGADELNKALDEIGTRNQVVLTAALAKVPAEARKGILNALEMSNHDNAANGKYDPKRNEESQATTSSNPVKENMRSATSTNNSRANNENKPQVER